MIGKFGRTAAASLVLVSPLCALADDLYTPGLYARGDEYLECLIVNVSPIPQKVTTKERDSTGASVATYTQVLAPGEYGGFSLPGYYGAVYCKFATTDAARNFRTSIETLAVDSVGTYVRAGLPGS
jgi:hypothetical protein